MKKLISVLFAVLVLSVGFSPLLMAVNCHLIDGEGLLSVQEAAHIEELLAEKSAKLGVDVLIRTTDSFEGKDPYYYADDSIDYDFGTVEDGILLLVSVNEGETFISTVGKCQAHLSESVIDSIYDAFMSDIRGQDYENAFSAYAAAVEKYYIKETTVFHLNATSIAVPLIVGLIIALVVVGMMKGNLKSARFHNAAQYLKDGSIHITNQQDLFLYTTMTRTEIRSESSGSGGSHTGSSGRSHGGHGRSI